MEFNDELVMVARVEGAGPSGFGLYALIPGARAILVGNGITDVNGSGEVLLTLPSFDALPTNTKVAFSAFFRDADGRLSMTEPVPFLVHPKPLVTVDFDWFASGAKPMHGSVVTDQWASAGLMVSAENASTKGPDLAMLYDSAHPTGDDMELVTPGSGPMNDEAQGPILVVAENAYDANGDGVLDFPDSANRGGKLLFRFDREVYLYEVSLIDIDVGQKVVIRGYRGSELVHDVRVPDAGYNLGDNNRSCMGFAAVPVGLLEVDLGGSGGVADISFMPATAIVDFDRTMTGMPLGLQSGSMLDDQFMADMGFWVRGMTWRASSPDQVIALDTARPTDGDKDLRTPGYHPTNQQAQGVALILAGNVKDVDGDGLVDLPDSDAWGGTMSFEFEYDVLFESASVLDVDRRENSYVELWSKHSDGTCALYELMVTLPFDQLGDNSFQTLYGAYPGVRRVDIVLDGSTAVTGLSFRRDEGWHTK
jgi:hypothetical protein